MKEAFLMSGYGGYVWSAFGVFSLVLITMLHLSRKRMRVLVAQLKNVRSS